MPRALGALLLGDSPAFVVRHFDVDEPLSREVLVRTAAAGLCHSDLHSVGKVPTPALLGHEAAGVVERVGVEVTYVKPGDHVVVRTSFCGTCEACMSGVPHLCRRPPGRGPADADRISVDGQVLHTTKSNLSGFADRLLVHENSCVVIADDIPLDVAALVGCAVITGIGAVVNTAEVRAGATVVVFGAGGIGLSVLQGARLVGATTIIAVDVHQSKLELATRFGATHVIDSRAEDVLARVAEITRGRGATHAFDAVGRAELVEQGLSALGFRGVMTMIGMIPDGDFARIGFSTLQGEKRLQGCSMGSNRFRLDVPMILDLYRQGRIMLDEMISRRGALADINDMFADMREGRGARQVVLFNGD